MIGGTRVDYFRDTLVKRAFIGSAEFTAVAGQHSMVQLWNPAQSGKLLICHHADVTVSASTFIYINHHNAALIGAPPVGNKYLGEAVGVGVTHNESLGAIPGTNIAYQYPRTNFDLISLFNRDPIIIPEGLGIVIAAVTVNLSIQATFEWIEV